MKKQLTISDNLKKVAEKVILDGNHLSLGNAKISYILVSPNISKNVAGRCIRTNNELNFFSDSDYIIEMSEDIWNALNTDTQEILMLHELMHIQCLMDDKSGDWKFGMRDHNIQDFSSIINKFGIDWISKIRTTAASIHDISEVELGEIRL